jgi:hypothetical protein
MHLHRVRNYLIAVVACCLAACSGDISNPISRKLNWFRYAAGNNVRDNCRPGALNQYRLIYNANWDEQVRAYDLRESALKDGSAVLFTQVFGGGYGFNVSNFTLDDVVSPSGGKSGQVRLSPDQYKAVVGAINASGFGQPAPKGLRLESYDFYWVVSACVDGQFHFNAWRFPSERFDATGPFASQLFALDGTGVPPNLPRRQNSAEQYSQQEFPRSTTYGGTPYSFEFIVGDNGLAGIP